MRSLSKILLFVVACFIQSCDDPKVGTVDVNFAASFMENSQPFTGSVECSWGRKRFLDDDDVALLRSNLESNFVSDPADDVFTVIPTKVGLLSVHEGKRFAEFQLRKGVSSEGNSYFYMEVLHLNGTKPRWTFRDFDGVIERILKRE